ncbi:UPF0307 protein [Saliniradius amylolyticus]|uniref:Dual-action ribosomal maturation protein DarP n=1 Tax=Saliniradius amylolyticus TaxID=2183582 RepID=A0A2S2DZL5_9ALTE|nr:ribosome biogenesis factor YjgA [Saliniradius amylolyticus]AWL10803.1 UPF0307 protein [Saliniradius amylolyticus]
MTDSDYPIDDQDVEFKSKTQIKREAEALQKLGTRLVELTPANLEKIPMDDELANAIHQARKINRKKDGFRRQLQFIGKLMRSRDPEPIQQALALIENQHNQATAILHKLEKWRDDIISKGDDAINRVLEEYPELDRQRLRQLYRQAHKEQQNNKPPKAAREIFQMLKEQTAL